MPVVYECDMTITHKEFFRLLPKALAGLPYQKNANQIRVTDGDSMIRITLAEESTRKLASLSLPMTQVHIELDNVEEADMDRFISRFKLAYQKGGG